MLGDSLVDEEVLGSVLDELVVGVGDSPDDDDDVDVEPPEPVLDAELVLVDGVDEPADEVAVEGVGALSDEVVVVVVVTTLAQASTKSNVIPHHLKSRTLAIVVVSSDPRGQKRVYGTEVRRCT